MLIIDIFHKESENVHDKDDSFVRVNENVVAIKGTNSEKDNKEDSFVQNEENVAAIKGTNSEKVTHCFLFFCFFFRIVTHCDLLNTH